MSGQSIARQQEALFRRTITTRRNRADLGGALLWRGIRYVGEQKRGITPELEVPNRKFRLHSLCQASSGYTSADPVALNASRRWRCRVCSQLKSWQTIEHRRRSSARCEPSA